ncbi:MAG: CRTAC1 family protein [Deltaproteobacteria bacterium]|nr:CRTAC1 family protein [Deltaproteobacteria bacterium]
MAKLALGLSTLVFVAVIALLWVQRDRLFLRPVDPEPIATYDPADPPPESILSAIEKLESESDAKCNSSANRFEDFLYGTPLSDEGRWANVDLQKRWVQRIWREASEVASRAGETVVSPQRLREQIEQWLDWSETPDGQIEVRFTNHPALTISKLRAEQYGSIAYSLRAILSVQQDRIFSSGYDLLTLAPGSIEVLRESTDTVTLSILMIADQSAREHHEFEITGAALRSARSALLPNLEDSTLPDANPSVAADKKSRAQLMAMLEEMIASKIAAYQVYNELGDRAATDALLRSVISRYYARVPIPQSSQAQAEFLSMFNGRLNEFAMDVLLEASANATAANHELIRAADASRAVQYLIPHEIDDFEDVKIFPRLAVADQITLEAYDCDSFRDFGLHWPPLNRAIRVLPKEARLPDPFAAEIIAEAISHYGVLLFRVAGDLAKQTVDNVRLHSQSIALSTAVIADRAKQDRNAPDIPEFSSRIVSVEGGDAAELRDLFFSDVTTSSGVDYTHRSSNWLHELRRKNTKTPPTFSGGGVAAEDVDGDGDMDLLFVGGGGNALYINDGSGQFRDITEQAGINFRGPDGSYKEARNPIIADFDNDGLQDILITYANDDHRLYRNTGGTHFENVSLGSGLLGEGVIAGPATAFDFDGDGLLDLYVGHLGDYLNGVLPTVERDTRNGGPNKLFRNIGGMRFEDVTAGSGAAGAGWTQAVAHTDFDRDGRQDIIVANDFGRNAFLRNLGNGKFENAALSLGVTNAYHSMNVGISDMNDDGHPDIYISNLASLVKDDKYIFPDVNTPMHLDLRGMSGMLVKESDVLYMSRLDGKKLIAYDPSKDIERGATSTGWAWDAEFFDFDCDGDDDLYLVNGTNDYHAYASIYNYVESDGRRVQHLLNHTRESNVFFVNDEGKLKNQSALSGADFSVNSRSTAYLDFDGDGDLDIAVNNFQSPALMFRNNAEERDPHWLKIRLIGDPSRGSNRDAIGARIVVTTDDRLHMTREIQGGSGYLSMNPKQQHFGLGRSQSADVQIIWPNGEQQKLENLAANHTHTVRQAEKVQLNSRVEHLPNLAR